MTLDSRQGDDAENHSGHCVFTDRRPQRDRVLPAQVRRHQAPLLWLARVQALVQPVPVPVQVLLQAPVQAPELSEALPAFALLPCCSQPL